MLQLGESVTLSRNCPAVQIPSGEKVMLSAGRSVTLLQKLGGAYTVLTDEGTMVRVETREAEAMGVKPDEGVVQKAESSLSSTGPLSEAVVLDQLKTVFDPEIPVNIVDLGLIYECRLIPLSEGENKVEIKMSMTAPGCGMGDILKEDARSQIFSLPGVKEVEVELVWEPPWDPSRMSEAAKLQLGMM